MTKKFPLLFLLLALTAAAILTTSPVSAVPPRPTRAPTPTPAPASPAGGLIVLTAVAQSPVSPDLWTRVQWQDPQGNWREVDGWRGAFDHNLTVTWWVAPADLNTGPFRWLVYASRESSDIIAVSDPFDLPPAPKQTTAVTITLPDN